MATLDQSPSGLVKGVTMPITMPIRCWQRYKSAGIKVITKIEVSPLGTGSVLTGDK